MFCWKCGKQIPDEAAFCMHCGTAMKKTEAQPGQKSAAQPVQKAPTQPDRTGEIPLPIAAIPSKPPRGKLTLEEIWVRFFCFAVTLGFGALGMLFLWDGIWILTVVFAILVICMITGWEQAMLPKGQKVLRCRRRKNGVEVSWSGKIGKFAIALDGSWAITGTGDRILIPDDVIAQHAALTGDEFTVLLAEITDRGVKYCGEDFYKR